MKLTVNTQCLVIQISRRPLWEQRRSPLLWVGVHRKSSGVANQIVQCRSLGCRIWRTSVCLTNLPLQVWAKGSRLTGGVLQGCGDVCTVTYSEVNFGEVKLHLCPIARAMKFALKCTYMYLFPTNALRYEFFFRRDAILMYFLRKKKTQN